MRITEFINKIDRILPPETAMLSFDKIGLQLQSGNHEVNKVLVAYEITPEVVEEAILAKVNMICTFHPLVFNPMINLLEDERQGNLVTKLIKNDISVFVTHTNFDAYELGTSRLLADKLGLTSIGFLLPDSKYMNTGMGTVAEVPEGEISENDLLERVKKVCGSVLRYNKTGKMIRRIGLVGGSGFSFINEVYANSCDAFITGDCSYHRFHEVFGKILLIDAGHNETEKFVAPGLFDLYTKNFDKDNIEFVLSKKNISPVFFY